MQNGFFCSCNFYNLKYLDIINWSFGINGSLFYFLRKFRKINKVLVKKKNQNINNIPNVSYYFKNGFVKEYKVKSKEIICLNKKNNKKRSTSNVNFEAEKACRKILEIKKYLILKNNDRVHTFFFPNSLEKLIFISKSLFEINCQRIKSACISIFTIFSEKINMPMMLYLLFAFSCKYNPATKLLFSEILIHTYGIQNLSQIFSYLRSLGWKRDLHFSLNILFFFVKLREKNNLKLCIYDIREIILTIKKYLININSKKINVSFSLVKRLFFLKNLRFIPKIQEIYYIIFNYFKNSKNKNYNKRVEVIEFFLCNLNLLNNPVLSRNILNFTKKYLKIQSCDKYNYIHSIILNLFDKNLLGRKTLLNFFANRKKNDWVNFSNKGINKIETLFYKLFENNLCNFTKKRFEKFVKYLLLEKDSIKISILKIILIELRVPTSYFTEEIVFNFFKFIFLAINRYSNKFSKKNKELKKLYQIIENLVLKLNHKLKPFLSQLSGLLKWSLNNIYSVNRKYGSRILTKIAPIFYHFGEKILLGHLGTILINNLNEKNPNVLRYFLQSLDQIVCIFPRNYCIPPIQTIFSSVISLIKNRNINVEEDLIKLLYSLISKKIEYIPRKDLILLCFYLVKMQKNLNLKNRKLSMEVICKIAKIHGPFEIVQFLIDFLEKSHRIFRVSIIVTLTSMAYEQNLHLILPAFYDKHLKVGSLYTNFFFKILIYILEYVEYNSLLNYINFIGVAIEKALFNEKNRMEPLLFLLIGKFSSRFKFCGLEKRLILLFKFILLKIITTTKPVLRYLFFSFEKLLITINPSIWISIVFQGLVHQKKKIRVLFWKFKKLTILNKNLSLFFFKYLSNLKEKI